MKKKYFDFIGDTFNRAIIPIFQAVLGGVILGLAYSKWMVPNEIINGGVTSLSMILSKISGMSISTYTQILTLVFLLLSFIFLGKKNFLLSIVSGFSYTIFFSFFYRSDFTLTINLPIDFLLASLFIAYGYYLSLIAGASTVGIEVIALIIKKYAPHVNLARLIRYLNYTVLIAGLLIYGLKAVIVGLLFSFLYSSFLEVLLLYRNKK